MVFNASGASPIPKSDATSPSWLVLHPCQGLLYVGASTLKSRRRTPVSQDLSHDCTLATASGLTRILASLHFGNHKLEGFLDVLVVPRRRFGPCAFELGGKRSAVFGGDLTLFRTEIGLVAYDDEGNPVDCLDMDVIRLCGRKHCSWQE